MKKKILSAAALGLAAVSLAGCEKDNTGSLQPNDPSKNVTMAISLCYKNQTMTSTQNSFTGPDGKTYVKGDLLPVYQQLEEDLNITINDVTETGSQSAAEKFEAAKQRDFKANGTQIALINSSVSKIYETGEAGNLVDLSQYLDYMPNFKKWLEENPAYEQMLRGSNGGIYTTPYFDGENELERMFLMNNDFVKKVLDDKVANDAAKSDITVHYNAWQAQDTAKDVEMNIARIVNGEPTATKITKKYSAFNNGQNIIDAQNALLSRPEGATGKELADQFVSYIETVYAGCGYTNYSDVFIGVDASYDANELIALMRVIRTNSQSLANVKPEEMVIMASREGKSNRLPDILRFAQIWGFRGLESRLGYIYFDANGNLQDARGDKFDENGNVIGSNINDALDLLNQLYNEGLIVKNVDDGSSKWRQQGVNAGTHFIGYDYNQSSTVFDQSTVSTSKTKEYTAVLPPMVNWNDGDDSTFMFQFSESIRSLKSDGWCIPKGVESDPELLVRALTVMDYFYSEEGNLLINYGPEEWRGEKFIYKGEEHYRLSDYSLNAIKEAGNWSNWMRDYVGCGLPVGHIRPMALEYQVLSTSGQKGIDNLNNAYLAGTFKWASNKGTGFYKLAPSIISIPSEFTNIINKDCKTYMDFYDTSKAVFINAVTKGFGNNDVKTKEELNSQSQKFYDVFVKYYRMGYNGEL